MYIRNCSRQFIYPLTFTKVSLLKLEQMLFIRTRLHESSVKQQSAGRFTDDQPQSK